MNESNFKITLLNDEPILKKIITDILFDLPEWFGIRKSTQEYIDVGSTLPSYVAYIDDKPIGFVSLKRNNHDELELYVLGVKKKYHQQGIGKKLLEKTIGYCKQNNIKSILVMTLDESYSPFDANYDATRKFYFAVGFKRVKVDTQIWGSSCPCLILKLNL